MFIKFENDGLTPEERIVLQERIATDPEYQDVAKFHKLFNAAFENPNQKDLYDKLNRLYDVNTKRRK